VPVVFIAELPSQPLALVRLGENDAVAATLTLPHMFSPVLSIHFELQRKIG